MTISVYCYRCRYFYFTFRCRAFPDRDIPDEIFDGKFDHSKPYPGDRGVRYRSRKELDARKDQVQCFKCKHYIHHLWCTAYMDGIPDEIIDGQVDHTQPYEGDNGIQFEPDDEVRDYW